MSNQSKKTKACNYVCNGISTCKEIEKEKKNKTVLLEVIASRILFLLSAQIFLVWIYVVL